MPVDVRSIQLVSCRLSSSTYCKHSSKRPVFKIFFVIGFISAKAMSAYSRTGVRNLLIITGRMKCALSLAGRKIN